MNLGKNARMFKCAILCPIENSHITTVTCISESYVRLLIKYEIRYAIIGIYRTKF